MWNAGVPTGDARVLLLGWSYKAEVGDPLRETPAKPLAETLIADGAQVGVWDPHIESIQYPENVELISEIEKAQGYDIAVLVTAHKACLNLDWKKLLTQMRTPLIYDGRRVLDLDSFGKIRLANLCSW